MFPIPADEKLSLFDIADYWAKEVTPRCTPIELLILLAKAWWRGDLLADNGPTRVKVLRALYTSFPDRIAFYVAGAAENPGVRELPDGSAEIWLWCFPLPNLSPESWTDTNCIGAFEALAAAWDSDLNDLAAPLFGAGVKLSETEFTRWIIDHHPWPTPAFWASGRASSSPARKLTKSDAVQLAGEYIQSEKSEGRRPTQRGFLRWTPTKGAVGQRDVLRGAYNDLARLEKIEVKPGRPRHE
jgi:hypothetical protein